MLPIPRTGYKTILSEKITKELEEVLEMGAPVKTAYESVGIAKQTFANWIKKAEADEFSGVEYEDSPYLIFRDRMITAFAKGEIKLLKELREGTNGWQAKAWMLERTRFNQYGLKQEVQHTVDMPGPSLPPKPPSDHEEWMKNKMERAKLAREEAEKNIEDADYKEIDNE